MKTINFIKSWPEMSEGERAEFRRLLSDGGFGEGLIHVGDVADGDDEAFFEQFIPFELYEMAPEQFVLDTQGYCARPVTLHAKTKFTVYKGDGQ